MRRDVVARRPKRHVLLPEGFLRLGLSLSYLVIFLSIKTLMQRVRTVWSIVDGGGGYFNSLFTLEGEEVAGFHAYVDARTYVLSIR